MPARLTRWKPPGPYGGSLPRTSNRAAYTHPAWPAIRQAVLTRDEWTCRACGKELHGDDATCDHIDEMQSGGVRITSDLSAYQALCRRCNTLKSNATRQGRAFVPPRHGGAVIVSPLASGNPRSLTR